MPPPPRRRRSLAPISGSGSLQPARTKANRRRRELVLTYKFGQAVIAPFVITNISQIAGTIDGGTVVTVTATGIVGTPSSTLGAVSNVTFSTFDITTNPHAAGTISFTIANGNGAPGGTFSYTYLAHPTFGSINPNNGPETIVGPTVTVTGTGLPANNTTGCPVAILIDGNPCTSVTVVNSTHVTGVPPIGSVSGAVNVELVVDGVSVTGVGAYTYNPPPVDISATNVGTGGGSGTITGANFVNAPTASVNINGTPTPLTITFVSSTQLTFVLPAGSYTAGTWPLTVTNPDGQSDTETIFQIDSSDTPQVIFGANLWAWWRSDTGLTSTTWADKTPNGNNLAGTWTVNASGSFQPLYPSLTFNGSTDVARCSSSPGALTELTLFVVLREVTTGANRTWVHYRDSGGSVLALESVSANTPAATNGGATGTFGMSITVPLQAYAMSDGSGNAVSCAAQNGTPGTASGTIAYVSGTSTITLAGTNSAAQANVEIVEAWIVINHKPTASELERAANYANLRNFNYSPSFVAATNIRGTGFASGSTGFRIQGTGTMQRQFVAGLTVSFDPALSIPDQTATVVNASVLEVPLPGGTYAPGTYSVTLTNPDGGSVVVSNGINVTNALDPNTIVGDLSCICWLDADPANVTTSSGKIVTFNDQVYLNPYTQGTAANRATATSSDPNFAGAPSATGFDGVQVGYTCAAVDTRRSQPDLTMLDVVFPDSANTNNGTFSSYNSALGAKTGISSGKPTVVKNNSVVAQWGSTIGGTAKSVVGYVPGTAAPTCTINVDNTGAVSGGAAGGALTNLLGGGLGENSGGGVNYKGSWAARAWWNRQLTSGELANAQTWVHGKYGV